MQDAPEHANFRSQRRFNEPSSNWRSAHWLGGAYDSARRNRFQEAVGELTLPQLTVFVTLTGSTSCTECEDSSGGRYVGYDFPGAVSIIPAGLTRLVRMSEGGFVWASLSIDVEQCAPQFTMPPIQNKRDPLIFELVSMLHRYELQFGIDPLIGESATVMLRRHLEQSYCGQPAPRDEKRSVVLTPFVLRRVTNHIEENLAQTLGLTQLAQIAGLSPSHFSRSFKTVTGVSPYAYVTRRRVERAKALMCEGSRSIGEIALECGFNNSSRFAAIFRREVGHSPREYMRLTKL